MSDEQVIRHIVDYRKLRKSAYPPIEEFIDAMYHNEKGNPVPLQEYWAKCEAVKSNIPKITE